MKLKTLFSAAVSAALLTTTTVIPHSTAYAVESFADATSFITDVLEVSLSGINSSSLDTALAGVTSQITTSGDEVLYEGSSIGYWYGDASTSLYSDSARTAALIEKTASGYKVDPALLSTLVEDVNNGITEVLTPTTDDWSKIIGKYDITLGDVTIPKEQWLTMELADDPMAEGKTVKPENLTTESANNYSYLGWIVDEQGEMYIQPVLSLFMTTGSISCGTYIATADLSSLYYSTYTYPRSSNAVLCYKNNVPIFKFGLSRKEDFGVFANVYVMGTTGNNIHTLEPAGLDAAFYTLYNISDSTKTFSGDLDAIKSCGILYFSPGQAGKTTMSLGDSYRSLYRSMFTSQSASNTIQGNKTLSRRVATLSRLASTDTLEVTSSGWLINDTTSIDEYLSMQTLNNAGDVADIAAVADVDPLGFNVILPTALPILVDSNNVVYVASNADITNKSGAAVKLTSVEIVPEAGSGWTSVEGTPSSIADTREFKFATTIEEDVVLDVDEVYPFQYSANLSPSTEALEAVELATVFVTVDWAA